MFNDNSKKILRYENLSNDLMAMQQQQQLNNSSNNNNNFTNYTISSNSYGYNVIAGSKKY